MDVEFPYHFDARGRTASADSDDHVRDLIEQVLLTTPGERVNRPDFGSGLLQMVFGPNSPELASALQFSAQASLLQWLGDLIDVHDVAVTSEDSTVHIVVAYVVRRTGETRTDRFVGAPS